MRIFSFVLLFAQLSWAQSSGMKTYLISDWIKEAGATSYHRDGVDKTLAYGRILRDILGEKKFTAPAKIPSQTITSDHRWIASALMNAIAKKPIQKYPQLKAEMMAGIQDEDVSYNYENSVFVVGWLNYQLGRTAPAQVALQRSFKVHHFWLEAQFPNSQQRQERIAICEAVIQILKQMKVATPELEKKLASVKTIPANLTFVDKKIALPKEQPACEKAGDLWDRMAGKCMHYTADFQKKCEDSSQCEGYCMVDEEGKAGKCSRFFPVKLRGCLNAQFFEKGRTFGGTVCSIEDRFSGWDYEYGGDE